MPHNLELYQILLDHIRRAPQQRISFAKFMELALYHPHHGYYASQDAIIGPSGDFITAPHLGHDFGELLAVQFADMWESLDRPSPFNLVEMGAGQGLIATDVLNYLKSSYPDCFQTLRYWIVEKSGALQSHQQTRLAPWQDHLRWATFAELPEELIGCFFSNELVDALPVHQVMRTPSGLQEIYVATAGDDSGTSGGFIEIIDDLSTPELATYFDFIGVNLLAPDYAEGYRTEVNLAALDWLAAVAAKLKRGFVLTIDYGYPASRYYNRVRSRGTLQCYYQHAHHDDPYVHVGHQDITAHVDFTALERQGDRCGLKTLGHTQQAMFLMALGLGDRLTALSQIQETDSQTVNAAIRRRDALHQLINPMGMGNFGVLAQAKGVTPSVALKGFTIPPLF